MKYIIAILLLIQATAIISPAEYIFSSDRPKIAAHRGLSSVFPENTIPSFHSAMYLGTDFIELDVVLNKDHELIVAHDTFMSSVSNIMELPQFLEKMTIRQLNGNDMENWWILDFTLEELKQVGINQVRGKMRSQLFDGQHSYPTLKEVLQLVQDFNALTQGLLHPQKKPVGILLEIKDYNEFHLQYTGKSIVELVVQELKNFGVGSIATCKDKVPIVLMSFDSVAVKEAQKLTDLPRVQLAKGIQNESAEYINEVSKYANILGIDLTSIWDSKTMLPRTLVEQIKNSAMLVYAWTFQDDMTSQYKQFNVTNAQEMYFTAINKIKVQGIITEFSGAAMAYAVGNKKD